METDINDFAGKMNVKKSKIIKFFTTTLEYLGEKKKRSWYAARCQKQR